MLQFKGNNLIAFSHTLSKLHKSALPNAIRFTLTDAAKDVKVKTLQKHSKKEFDIKNDRFFKALSGYQQATGWDIGKMKSTVGMIKGKNSKATASTQVGKQQYSGTVPHRAYIGAEEQRNAKGLLKPSYKRLTNIKPIVFDGGNYIKKAIEAKSEGKPLLVKVNNKGVLAKVKKIRKKSDKPVETEVIASYEKGRSVKLKTRHPFLINAMIESGKKLDNFYIKNAKRQIERLR